ncbi:Imm7 family immunity protein [Paenibacillus sp. LHD-117]|uniref:Imm7 family immunity protein n=1 Tax=Paenibacillus sp. LHD-117 TaxID=3071412 RepID=UPI0027DF1675|nr:Imm7 family immunity protein [Paenibacillus sp. LHD-117]MDQ6420473.1 Imm7 family immunity protein [Paenibacillus sp. LHD-117]
MFEFHGWIVLRYHTHDTNEILQDKAYNKFINYLKVADTEGISTVKRRNGLNSWVINGLHNHRSDYVLEMYKWVSENLPGSYGLLYIHDDEDVRDHNKFVVWKLARGALTCEKDSLLSPYIPVVEDEYDPKRND